MSYYFMCNGVVWETDPLGKFPELTQRDFLESLGLIPGFFNLRSLLAKPREEFIEEVLRKYGFPSLPMTGGMVKRDGTYLNPGDPPLHPMAMTDVGSVRVYVYSYGIISFVHKDKTEVYRLD